MVLIIVAVAAMVPRAFSQRVSLGKLSSALGEGTLPTNVGALPESQMLTLEARLKPLPERETALDELIAAQMQAGSASYRKWIDTDEFAARFGATDKQIAAVKGWLESQGLSVGPASAGKTRILFTGSVAQVQRAFAVDLRRYKVGDADYFANASAPTVPAEMADVIAGLSGLNDKRLVSPTFVQAISKASELVPLASSDENALAAIEKAVDANASSILLLSTSSCSANTATTDHEAYRAALRQAEAQGVTVLATSGCKDAVSGNMGSFPASLAEVTAVAQLVQEEHADAAKFVGIATRPTWQFADGLPADEFREEPDVSADVLALARTLARIEREAGTRLGNVAPVLYELAKTPRLFTQTDGAAAGTWERPTGLGIVDLKVLEDVFPKGSIGTSSLLAAADYAPVHGHNLTLTATVTSTGGSGIPTGTVTFTSTQKGTLGTATLDATGVATFSSSTLPGGTYTLTSVYSGDATYTGSTSGVATVTIVGEVSVITATVEAGAIVGGNAAIDVSVSSGSGVGTPSGTVTVAPQGTTNSASASATISGTNGTATGTVQLPVFQAGQFTLLVSCMDPDPSFTCYSPVSVEMVVGKGVSTTTITASPNSPAVGDSYTLTAAVAAGAASASARRGLGALLVPARGSRGRKATVRAAGVSLHALDTTAPAAPTGSVQFLDGATVLGTQAIDSGTATYTGTATSASHNFSAVYSGDQNYQTSNSSTPTTPTGGLPTSTSLTASTYAIAAGQSITFYSTVYSVGVPSTMTGTVTYTAATQGVLGTATVSAGLATLTLTSLPVGIYNLSATYSGDATFASSTSTSTVILTVTGSNVTLAGSITPNPVPYGSDATLVATATLPAGLVGPAGTLQAVISGVTGATYTQPLVASATGPSSKATFTFAAPPPGKYSVIVSCTASDTFACGAPVTVPLTVVQGVTQTVLSLNPAGPLAGQKTTLTAVISNTGNDPGAYVFTGSVQFFVNGKSAGTSGISGGMASVSVALAAGAAQSIYAVYSGDTNWKGSTSSPVTVSVAAVSTSVVLTSNVSNVIAGVQVVLTATVTSTSTAFIPATAPSGLVDFFDTSGGVLSKLGSSALAGLGANTSVATFNATGLQAGTHVLYAVYEGDAVYLGSTSPTLTLGLTSFSATFVPDTMTLVRGQRGQATLIVNYMGGFAGTVSFGCVPPPNVELTCSFTPAALLQPGTTTLNVATVAPSAVSSGQHAEIRRSEGVLSRFAEGTMLAALTLFIKPRRTALMLQNLRTALWLLLVAVAIGGSIGCGGTVLTDPTKNPPISTTPSDPGTSLGTQILTITAAGSDGTNTVRHDLQFQVTVQ